MQIIELMCGRFVDNLTFLHQNLFDFIIGDSFFLREELYFTRLTSAENGLNIIVVSANKTNGLER